MKIIVDTSIWSLALRRKRFQENSHVKELQELIAETRAQLIGPVRQELLNGIKSKKQFQTLKNHLKAFHDIGIRTVDYELASEYFNLARQNGIQGSNTDFLICALSVQYTMPIFTTDKDFFHYQKVIPIELHGARA